MSIEHQWIIEALNKINTTLQQMTGYIEQHTWSFIGEPIVVIPGASATEGRVQVDTKLIGSATDTTTLAAVLQVLTNLISTIDDTTTIAGIFTNSKQFAGTVIASVTTIDGIVSNAHTKFYADADGISGGDGSLSVTTLFAGGVDAIATVAAEFFREG